MIYEPVQNVKIGDLSRCVHCGALILLSDRLLHDAYHGAVDILVKERLGFSTGVTDGEPVAD